MIITLKGANFSTNNIGTLSTWTVSRVLGDGATYNGVTYVDKNAALNATVTIAEGYEINGSVTVTMGGSAVTSGITVDGNTITIAIASVTGNVVIKVPTKNTATGEEEGGNAGESGGAENTNEYNSADMWLSQTISAIGAVSTTGITQSNIMAKSRFVGSATFESLGEAFQMALVTYNDDGSFKARGSWTSLTQGSPVTFEDENPFNVVIATKTTNTSYTVEQMVAMLNVVGTSEESMWDGTIYSDSASYWVRQGMDSGGNVIPTDNAGYNRSNLMGVEKFSEPIKITAKSAKLMTSMVTYDASEKFVSRASWTTVEVGQSVTYTDANPFNVIIATSAESTYGLDEMLALIDVRSA